MESLSVASSAQTSQPEMADALRPEPLPSDARQSWLPCASVYELKLSPRQEARVEALMDTPLHEMEREDRILRMILGVQRLRAALQDVPAYQKKAQQSPNHEWGYWHVLWHSQVNTLLPRRAPSTK